jgi:hypothetical protein
MNKQELAEQIAKKYKLLITNEESLYRRNVLAAIVEAMGVQQEKEQPSLQSGKLSAEEVLYKHVLADADNHVMGTTLTVTVPPLEELKNNQQFQMHVAAMKEYAQQVYATAAPTKAVEAMDVPAPIPDVEYLAEQIFKKHTERSAGLFEDDIIRALVEMGKRCMNTPAKEVEAISDSEGKREFIDQNVKNFMAHAYFQGAMDSIQLSSGEKRFEEWYERNKDVFSLLHNEQNDERIATQQTMPQGTEAGIKEAAKEDISVPAQQPSLEEKKP